MLVPEPVKPNLSARQETPTILNRVEAKPSRKKPTPVTPAKPRQPKKGDQGKIGNSPMSRRRMLQLAGWGGMGLGGVIVGRLLFSSEDEPSPPPTQPEEGEEEKPPTSSQPEPSEPEPPSSNLAEFSFEVVTVNDRGEINQRTEETAQQLVEEIGNGVNLEMVEIPSGSFLMGSPETEEERDDNEGPQHRVEVPGFLMGKYQVTQAQYEAIMGENPSRFSGANNPVERVNWYKAKEFCKRLSEKTGREYRLPSEAEWEYACRAGTTTPFYFGETITTDLANYDGDYTYGNGPEGVDREKTTPVGSFPPNAFGLYDMHGNVWEWCEDVWHENYEGAPNDGRPWLTGGNHNRRVLRGGSWTYNPRFCRCANRYWLNPDFDFNYYGFRVVSSSVRTL
jgi:formylglycine-generating enzyme required for sulfatase activity